MPRPRAAPPPPSVPPSRPPRPLSAPGTVIFSLPSFAAAASPEPPHPAVTPMTPANASPYICRTTLGRLSEWRKRDASAGRNLPSMRTRELSGRQVIVDGSAGGVHSRGQQGELGIVHFELSAQASLKSK